MGAHWGIPLARKRIDRNEVLQMKYDFTTIMDRHGKDAIAVDVIPCGWQT